MALSNVEQVRALARLVGIHIFPEEEGEVANRFDSLMQELARLVDLVTIFPEEV